MSDDTCSVDRCSKPIQARSWCAMHYGRWRRGQDFALPFGFRGRGAPCSVERCEQRSRSRGFCNPHYRKWKRYGDPLAPTQRSAAYGTHRSTTGPYVRLWMPDHPLANRAGYLHEHRLVVWEAGLDPTGFDVHHKNHDRQDNRLGNLDLLTPAAHTAKHRQEEAAAKAAAVATG